ncbi:hypothetical protein AB0M43_14805 [Longispora sp. NPDC051575]|uniref:hypothetical protein n=1 Tax=Longispora sp. NPDC051575 TaxID=3154943 RepID=UPI00342596A5
MNLSDLKGVLAERAEVPEGLAHRPRLAAVRGKVARRRQGKAAACVLALVAGLGLVLATLPGQAPEPAVPKPDPTRTVHGFLEYEGGDRVVLSAEAAYPQQSLRLEYTPTKEFRIEIRCPAGQQLMYELAVDGENVGRRSVNKTCQGGGVVRFDDPNLKAPLGNRMEITLTMSASPEVGTFGLAVAERVPVAEFPLPPRPSHLTTVERAGRGWLVLNSDPAAPGRSVSRTVTWQSTRYIWAELNTPGVVKVLVDGVEVHRVESWIYTGATASRPAGDWRERLRLPVDPGQQVTVQILVEGASGDWRVDFRS